MSAINTRRILLVDDNESIHKDIKYILSGTSAGKNEDLQLAEAELFGDDAPENAVPCMEYEIDHAYQGEEAIEKVKQAENEERPYSLIFMDVRMPPGMDGIQAIKNIWSISPNTEVVICTAYSDYSWEEIVNHLGFTDKLLFMKKPFDTTALKQTTQTLVTKWQLQQEAIQYTERLEWEVKTRTEKLEKMKIRAEQATEMKSQFLANMSHEIRTPMNGIIGMNELLMETDLTDEQYQFVERIKNSANSLLRIINDILDFSKIEAGRLELEEIPFQLTETIDEVMNVITVSAREKQLEIYHSIDERLPATMVGDPVRIRQVLLNYASNAVKFTNEGYIDIRVTLVAELNGQYELKFTVTDTGIGIPEEKQHLLFEAFSQTDSATTRKYGGTGLGIAICKQLAELMDGEVGFDSREGEGSTFWFTALLNKAGEQTPGLKSGESEEGQEEEPEERKPAILLAEDNEMNQFLIEKMLAGKGYTIDFVETGSRALEFFRNNQYDLILMDIQMPEMDGFEATEAIREDEKGTGRRVPIIALTASAMQTDKDKCFQCGMDNFLSKPFEKHKLKEVIEHYTSNIVTE